MEKIDQNKVPKRKFYTGEEIPAVGLGTFGSDKYGPEAISEAVYGAIKFGYRPHRLRRRLSERGPDRPGAETPL